MNAIQLEMNLDNKTEEECFKDLQDKRVDALCDSMGKVRRKLFAENTEMRKICAELKRENEDIKKLLAELKNEKVEWEYKKGDYLFNVREHKEVAC